MNRTFILGSVKIRRFLSPFLSGSALLLASSVNCGGDTSSSDQTDAGGARGDGDGDGDAQDGAGGDPGENKSPASYCRSDKDCKDADELCDTERSVCVECVTTTDCGENELCRRNDCVEVTPCSSSKHCDFDEICSNQLGYCVGCEGDNDCGSGESCVYFSCLPSCSSDKDCASVGMVCFSEHSVCVDCVQDRDCEDDQSCNEVGECVERVCAASDVFCDGDLLASCADTGTGFLVMECEEGCSEAGKSAACAEGEDNCVTGDEGCACYPNSSCNGTLSCLSNFCVDQSSGGSGGAGSGGAGSGGAGSGGAGSGGAGSGGTGSGGAGSGGTGSGANCVTITSATPIESTRYPASPPYTQSISDGLSTINAIRYDWVGWFSYDVTFPVTGFYTISVRVADDGYLVGTDNEAYNSFSVSVSGTERLFFDGMVDTYEDGASPQGDMAFHNVTSASFAVTAGTSLVRLDNIVDKFEQDSIDLYLAYIEICPVE